jgi:hypothetical protein
VGDGHGDLPWCFSEPPGSRLDPRAVEPGRRLASTAHRNPSDRNLNNDRVVAKLPLYDELNASDQWRICFLWEDRDAYDVEAHAWLLEHQMRPLLVTAACRMSQA